MFPLSTMLQTASMSECDGCCSAVSGKPGSFFGWTSSLLCFSIKGSTFWLGSPSLPWANAWLTLSDTKQCFQITAAFVRLQRTTTVRPRLGSPPRGHAEDSWLPTRWFSFGHCPGQPFGLKLWHGLATFLHDPDVDFFLQLPQGVPLGSTKHWSPLRPTRRSSTSRLSGFMEKCLGPSGNCAVIDPGRVRCGLHRSCSRWHDTAQTDVCQDGHWQAGSGSCSRSVPKTCRG